MPLPTAQEIKERAMGKAAFTVATSLYLANRDRDGVVGDYSNTLDSHFSDAQEMANIIGQFFHSPSKMAIVCFNILEVLADEITNELDTLNEDDISPAQIGFKTVVTQLRSEFLNHQSER